MISFCDIPLSQSYEHFDAYGKYGIGLKKEWANKMGINPVLYLESNSSATKALGKLLRDRRNENSNLTEEQKLNILRIKCFSKNYSGRLKRKNIDDPNYRFYNEREWRLVPTKPQLQGEKFSISLSEYEKSKKAYNDRIDHLRFNFSADDISYIIVKSTVEISKVINTIRNHFKDKCAPKSLDLLFSKVASTEQILKDY